MKRPFRFAFAIFGGLILLLTAQTPKAKSVEQTLRASRWQKRVLLLAAPNAGQADFKQQKALLAAAEPELAARDVLVLEVLYNQLTEADKQFLTRKLGLQPPLFAALLIGKDGGVKQQSSRPIPPADLFDTVDKMPMRREELRRTRPGQR
ncbi:DUF4174 domain-containing protein [Hymenobacter antarcticus]|uniref:DUF4174 domain-containing protein n=1 Tax=Hymenobacter antarcticus TaxID=486270 RepID=A0ABP7R5F6_9BACT